MTQQGKKGKLRHILFNARIKTVGSFIVLFLVVYALGVIGQTAVTLLQIEDISATWEDHDHVSTEKSIHLSELKSALGYGGAIHEFKNLILRKDRLHVIKVHGSLRNIELALMDYSALDISQREAEALQAISAIHSKYSEAVAVVERSIIEGADSREIDRLVRIDDRAALAALNVLASEVDRARTQTSARVYGSVMQIRKFAYITSTIVGISLLILIVSVFWFTRWRLSGPLTRLTDAMATLARGDTSTEIPQFERLDEIGAMARSVEVFKENMQQRLSAEKELAEASRRSQRASETARLSEERFEGILNLAPEAIISVDDKGFIRLFNQGAEECFGYAAEEIIGMPIEVLMPQRFRDRHPGHVSKFQSSSDVRQAMKGREPVFAVRKDGSEFPAEAAISKLKQRGEMLFTVMLRDITERLKVEEASRAAREEAEIASRAKSEFLANMSHELRTPLNGVLGMASVLLETDLTRGQSDKVRIISESGDVLLTLLNDILDLAKIEAGRFELDGVDFSPHDLVSSIADLWQPRFDEKGVAFQISCDIDRVLHGDPQRIRQVLNNLVSNAQKFTHSGSVTLDVRQTSYQGDKVELRVSVSDTGIGIGPETLPVLFDNFSQADTSITRKYGGTGLGLAICNRLVGLMDGEIGVESKLGEGAAFWFTIRCEPAEGSLEAVASSDVILLRSEV